MGSFTDYLETAITDHVFMQDAFTSPTALGLAIGTFASETGDFFEVQNGDGYARVVITAEGDWNVAASRSIDHSATWTFPTASASWGTPTFWAIFDSTAHASGNMLAYGDITTPTAIGNNDTPSFAAGEIAISFNSDVSNVGWGTAWVDDILDHIFRNSAGSNPLAQPANLWVAFGQTPFSDADAITGEATGNGYARFSTDGGDWWDSGSGLPPGATANASNFGFTVSGPWTTNLDVIFITSHASNSANADLVAFGTISSFSAVSGDTVQVNINDLNITLI